jgi:hypothetical protein
MSNLEPPTASGCCFLALQSFIIDESLVPIKISKHLFPGALKDRRTNMDGKGSPVRASYLEVEGEVVNRMECYH